MVTIFCWSNNLIFSTKWQTSGGRESELQIPHVSTPYANILALSDVAQLIKNLYLHFCCALIKYAVMHFRCSSPFSCSVILLLCFPVIESWCSKLRVFLGQQPTYKAVQTTLGWWNRVTIRVLYIHHSVIHVWTHCLIHTSFSWFLLLLFYRPCMSLKGHYHDSDMLRAHYESSTLLYWGH